MTHVTDFLTTCLRAGWAERTGWTLVHSLWQIAAITGVYAFLILLLRNRSASARYVVGCVAMAAMLALPAVTYVVLPPSAVPEAEVVSNSTPVAAVPLPKPSTTPREFTFAEPEVITVDPLAAVPIPAEDESPTFMATLSSLLQHWTPWITAAWLIGVLLLSFRPLWGWLHVRRLRRHGLVSLSDPLQDICGNLATRLGVRRAVEFAQSALVEVPTVVGYLKPMVLLPASALSGLSTSQIELILAHELAHVRRHDYLVNLVQTVVESLLFYHPGVWWVSSQIRRERENCCDDTALALGGSRANYVRALAQLEERRSVPAAALAASGGSLLLRARRLLGQPQGGFGYRHATAWLAGLLTIGLVAAALAMNGVAQGDVEGAAKEKGKPGEAVSATEEAKSDMHPTLRWGPVTDGLRMAAKLLPEKETYALGEKIELEFHLRNVSDHAITVAGFSWRQDMGPDCFVIKNDAGETLDVDHVFYTGFTPIQRNTLEPGEIAVFKSSPLVFLAKGMPRPEHPVGHTVMTGPGRHTLQFNLIFPGGSSGGPNGMPQPTDWHGTLRTGTVEVSIVDPKSAPAEANEPTPSINDTSGKTTDAPNTEEVSAPKAGEIVWDKPRRGWHVGVKLASTTDKLQPGEPVTVQLLLKNVTDKPRTVVLLDYHDTDPVLGEDGRIYMNVDNENTRVKLGPDGRPVITAKVPGDGSNAHPHVVAPGGVLKRSRVVLVTNGLPPGAYCVDPQPAFWEPNRDDPGWATEIGWNTPVRFTLGNPASVKYTQPPKEIDGLPVHWGKPVCGLIAGVQLPREGEQRSSSPWDAGEMFVRNVSNRAIRFEYKGEPSHPANLVKTSDGKNAGVTLEGSRLASERFSHTLQPGEQVRIPKSARATSIFSWTEETPSKQDGNARRIADGGQSMWNAFLTVRQEHIPGLSMVVSSEAVPYEVGGESGESSGAAAATEEPRAEEVLAAKTDNIIWDKPRRGWQVGAKLLSTTDMLRPGDPVVVQLLLKNATEESRTVVLEDFSDARPTMGAGGRISMNISGDSANRRRHVILPGAVLNQPRYRVVLGTEGIVPGTYVIDPQPAFWEPGKDDPNRATGIGRNTPVRFTLGDPTSVKYTQPPVAKDPAERIYWGEQVSGLVVGMRLPQGRTKWPNDAKLEPEMFVRNVSDRTIELEYEVPPPGEWSSQVKTSDGKDVRLDYTWFSGYRPRVTRELTLKPGEQARVAEKDGPAILVQKKKTPVEYGNPKRLITDGGRYTWTAYLTVQEKGIPDLTMVVGSGAVPFEVTGEGSEASGKAAAIEETRAEDIRVPKTGKIIWEEPRLGPPTGWQVGAKLLSDTDKFKPGDPVDVQLLLKNVTDKSRTVELMDYAGTHPTLGADGRISMNISGDQANRRRQVIAAGAVLEQPRYRVILGTEGMLPGEYSINPQPAFWEPNQEDPKRATLIGRNMPVPFTLGDPKSVKYTQPPTEKDPAKRIYWGKPVSGLVAGMRLPQGRTKWPNDARIEGEMFVRNVSDRTIECEYEGRSTGEWGSQVRSSDGKDMRIEFEQHSGVYRQVAHGVVLEPGQQARVVEKDGPIIEIQDRKAPSTTDVFLHTGGPPRLITDGGRYTWTACLTARQKGIPNLTMLVRSGNVPFEIEADDDDASEKAVPIDDFNIPDLKTPSDQGEAKTAQDQADLDAMRAYAKALAAGDFEMIEKTWEFEDDLDRQFAVKLAGMFAKAKEMRVDLVSMQRLGEDSLFACFLMRGGSGYFGPDPVPMCLTFHRKDGRWRCSPPGDLRSMLGARSMGADQIGRRAITRNLIAMRLGTTDARSQIARMKVQAEAFARLAGPPYNLPQFKAIAPQIREQVKKQEALLQDVHTKEDLWRLAVREGGKNMLPKPDDFFLCFYLEAEKDEPLARELPFAGSDETFRAEPFPCLTEGAVLEAKVVANPARNVPAVEVELTEGGTKRFAKLTRDSVGKRLAIVIDGKIVSAPLIRAEIPSGRARIDGSFTIEEAKKIADTLNAYREEARKFLEEFGKEEREAKGAKTEER